MGNKLILASSSPRRQALLKQVGIDFSIRVADVDEKEISTLDPIEKVKQLALLKGRRVPFAHDEEIILSADTIVSYHATIFEKPIDEEDAYRMIHTLSGEKHEVFTGFAIRSIEKEVVCVERTIVEFWPIDKAEIKQYVETKEPYDKAGAYGIQSVGAQFVKHIVGDYYTVVGLPISRVVRELKSFGIDISQR